MTKEKRTKLIARITNLDARSAHTLVCFLSGYCFRNDEFWSAVHAYFQEYHGPDPDDKEETA